MEIKQYKYSAGQMFFEAAVLVFLMLWFYVSIITHNAGYKSWLVLGCLFAIPVLRFIYLYITYFAPCLKGKTALELDEDKLQLFIKGKLLFQIPRDVAYWKDIKDIEYTSRPSILSFKMNDGSVFGFSTRYIAGNDKEIYNTVMAYFKNQKSVPAGDLIEMG